MRTVMMTVRMKMIKETMTILTMVMMLIIMMMMMVIRNGMQMITWFPWEAASSRETGNFGSMLSWDLFTSLDYCLVFSKLEIFIIFIIKIIFDISISIIIFNIDNEIISNTIEINISN